MTPPPANIALTGITGFANSYLETFEQIPPDVSVLKAVTAINREDHEDLCRGLEAKGTEVFPDFDRMIRAWRNRIDLCVLPVPIHLHLPMTLAATRAGMNVLLEKPMAGSVAQGREICEADKGPQRIAIGFQDMYRPSTRRISDELRGGRIGTVTGVRTQVLWPRKRSYYDRNNWAGAIEVDGQTVRDSPINNATAHYSNLALFFAGNGPGHTARVETVEAELFRGRTIDSFDTAVIRGVTDTGVSLHSVATHSCQFNETATVVVEGEKGRLIWKQGETFLWETPQGSEEQALEGFPENRILTWKSILHSLQTGGEFCCTPEMAMSHVELVEKLHSGIAIRDFPPERLVTEPAGKDQQTYLPGLDRDLKRCQAENALPSELGFNWAG